MVRLLVDGVELTLVDTASLYLSLSAECMRSVEKAGVDNDFVVEVEADDVANKFFSGESYLHDGEMFNASYHRAEVLCYGEVVLSGKVILLQTTLSRGTGSYKLRIRRAGAAWATSAEETLVHDLGMEYYEVLNIALVKESWEDDSFIKYFPVYRDNYDSEYSTSSTSTVRRLRSIDDYHPFINVKALMEQIFAEGGYSIESQFMESEAFGKLYMSGAYVSQDSDAAKEKMDFYVERLEDGTAVADYQGRVMMSPLYSYNTVGYVVDYESIEQKSECYSLSGCFSVENYKLCFTPTKSVSVGFEFRVKYVTDYIIRSRTELTAFDTLYLNTSTVMNYGVANQFVDMREESLTSLFSYLVVVFDGDEDQGYRLDVEIDGASVTLGSWVGKSGYVTTPQISADSIVGEPVLKVVGVSSATNYEDDWALYQGYVTMEGQTEVDITIRSAPEQVSPSSPKYFTAPYISGAEEGMGVTIKAGTSITPYFASYPGFGSYVEYEDLSQHEFYASDFIESIRHLFNLSIYSDLEASTVYIEPEENIYDEEQVWDWSDRLLSDVAVVYTDVAVDSSATRKWGYQANDGVTNRINGFFYVADESYPEAPNDDPQQSVESSISTDYGSWQIDIGSYAANDSTSTELNPIFSPTQNSTSGLPIVGDRDDPDMADTLEFSPRILSWEGMMEQDNETIPNVVFHSEELGVTLCFEDRDGLDGLNRYYRAAVARAGSARYVEVTLRLTTSEVLALSTPLDGMPNMLSTFELEIEGERCRVRIESVEASELGADIAKCKFLIIS